ncbi:MAG: calcium-binding protein, partial [Coleofasciculaceae cyanobacterium RL_1_1]|nr:calcium-binding protein [Coleofasciculaceae cyanobacterium RL_1_1]
MTTIIGTELADLILPDLVFDDRLLALGNVDDVIGGDGDDTIATSNSADRIDGGNGDDLLFGNRGRDTLAGGADDDVIYAGQDHDLVFGQQGDDRLYGELGDDTILGGSGDDTIYGGDGQDSLRGDRGRDVLSGGSGDDRIDGGRDRDVLTGGSGMDAFVMGRNFDGSTTGGATLDEADLITDFSRGVDRFLLTERQRFRDLTFATNNGDTIVRDSVTGNYLAIVAGVADLDITDFVNEISSPGTAGSISLSSDAYTGREALAGAASPERLTIAAVRSGGDTGAVSVTYSTAAGRGSLA